MGIGNVIVSRKLPRDDLGVSVFLIDVYCLGVKDALFRVISELEYPRIVKRFKGMEVFQKTDPACARKLVEEAEAYGKQIGFDPHPDYKSARKIFGDIDASLCPSDFIFGKDGMPFFCSGPNDSPAKCRRIIDTLSKHFGPDGFHWTIGAGPEDLAELESLGYFDD